MPPYHRRHCLQNCHQHYHVAVLLLYTTQPCARVLGHTDSVAPRHRPHPSTPARHGHRRPTISPHAVTPHAVMPSHIPAAVATPRHRHDTVTTPSQHRPTPSRRHKTHRSLGAHGTAAHTHRLSCAAFLHALPWAALCAAARDRAAARRTSGRLQPSYPGHMS